MKVLEDYFSELQSDMVTVCLEYVDNKAEEIFIYCSYEPKMYVFDFFYKIDGEIVHKHQLNDVMKNFSGKQIYDTSKERQKAALKIGNQNLKAIHKKCNEYNQEMPTQIKFDSESTRALERPQNDLDIMQTYIHELGGMVSRGEISIGDYSVQQLSQYEFHQALISGVRNKTVRNMIPLDVLLGLGAINLLSRFVPYSKFAQYASLPPVYLKLHIFQKYYKICNQTIIIYIVKLMLLFIMDGSIGKQICGRPLYEGKVICLI